tara:strand:- start:659 stop:1462 length:804 start_codon:yes stop_codon:yes gene_type:complete
MIITHEIEWDKCLSHKIWPAIKKGWKDTQMRPIHFFWGLAGKNIPHIKGCIERNEEWWYVDNGYLTQQITRYPEPKIHDLDKTYFRIVKGGLHTLQGKSGSVDRLRVLENQGIDVQFKGWTTNTEHILLCPSSPTVTFFINDMSQEEWEENVRSELRQHTDRPIKFRNKPRPGNQWWNTDIKEDLKGCHCLITNMSLAAVDAVINQVPVLTHRNNVAFKVSIDNIHNINKTPKHPREVVEPWLNMLSHNQFTIPEIEEGLAYKILNE